MASVRKLHVPSCEELIAACDEDIKNDALTVCEIRPNEKGKFQAGTEYYPYNTIINGHKYSVLSVNGTLSDDPTQLVTITDGLPDPNNPKDAERIKQNTNERTGARKYEFGTNVKHAGVLGQAFLKLNRIFEAKIKSLNKDPKYKFQAGRKGEEGVMRQLKGFLTTHYGDKAKDETLHNTERHDDFKIIKFRVNPFELYDKPLNGCKVGDPKTAIYDYDTMTVEADGTKKFKHAQVNGEPLSPDNIHEFIRGGSIIHKARLRFNCVVKSASWVSIVIEVDTMVIQSRRGNFVYEDDIATASVPAVLKNTNLNTLAAAADLADALNDEEDEEEEETETETEIEVADEVVETEEDDQEEDQEPVKPTPVKVEPAKVEPAKQIPAKVEPAKSTPVKVETVKPTPAKVETPTKVEPVKVEPAKQTPVKVETPAKVETPTKVEPAKAKPAAKTAAKPAAKKTPAKSAEDLVNDLSS
jgi:hypothetical protein